MDTQKELNEINEIQKQTGVLLAERDDAYRTVQCLKQMTGGGETFQHLMPSRIKSAQKRMDEIQEQIDFNIAYCEMRVAEVQAAII